MKTGYITIEHEAGGATTVNARLVDGTLWLTSTQMAQLFGVFTQKVEGCLKVGFRTGILVESEACRVYHYLGKQGRACQATFYNLEALLFVGYRIASHHADVFRRWAASALREHLQKEEVQRITELCWTFYRTDGYPVS